MATLSELETRIGHIESLLNWITPRARQSSNLSRARVNSVDQNNYCYCNVTLIDTNIVLVNVPITISEYDRCAGQMPTEGSIVWVEHQGEGQSAKIVNIASIDSNIIEPISNKKGCAYIVAQGIPK